MDCHDGNIALEWRTHLRVKRYPHEITATLVGRPAPRMLHKDPAHEMRRDAEEVRAVLPLHLPLVDKLQVGIVDEGGRLQCVTGTFAAEIIVSQPTKLFIYSVHKLVSSVLIPRAPLDEPPCDV